MNSGILDRNGVEVKEGDTLIFPWISPIGEISNDPGFEAQVVFKHGAFGVELKTEFVPLLNWLNRTKGEYVPNYGNKIELSDKGIFWIKKTQ